MSENKIPSLAQTRASVIVGAIFCGVFTLNIMFEFLPEILGGFLGGVIWPVLAFIGGALGSYRGAMALKWPKAVTALITIVSILPPVAFVIHMVLLVKLAKAKDGTVAS